MLLPIAAFVVLVVFLGCLGLFALAVTKVVAPDGKGHARGLVGGCAALLALFLLCGLGLAGLAATVGAVTLGSLAEWNPIQRIEIQRGSADRSGEHDALRDAEQDSVSARFTVRGDAGGELVELLHDLVDVDLAELGDGLTVHQRVDDRGEEFHVYEFRLPISEHELARLEHDLDHELEGLRVRLPEHVDIQFEGAE